MTELINGLTVGEMRVVERAATDGFWVAYGDVYRENSGDFPVYGVEHWGIEQAGKNRVFIAMARNAFPALLDALEDAQEYVVREKRLSARYCGQLIEEKTARINAEAERDRLKAEVERLTSRRFPIQEGLSLPWAMIAPHEEQAFYNHDQSLERLAERGGLSSAEALCVLDGLNLRDYERDGKKARTELELRRSQFEDGTTKLQARVKQLEGNVAWLNQFAPAVYRILSPEEFEEHAGPTDDEIKHALAVGHAERRAFEVKHGFSTIPLSEDEQRLLTRTEVNPLHCGRCGSRSGAYVCGKFGAPSDG